MTHDSTQSYQSQQYACSDTGRIRDHNEDSYLSQQWPPQQPGPLGITALLAVADGMGGHQRGDWASKLALDTVLAFLESADEIGLPETLESAVMAAHRAVYEGFSADDEEGPRPGTTLTLATISADEGAVAHVGDSRLYLLRSGELSQITEDHSLAALLIQRGELTKEEARVWEHRNQILRAVGVRETLEVSSYTVELQEEDVLLLCSDGLSGMLTDEEISQAIASSVSATQAGERLCAAANAAGGEDNITAVVYGHRAWPEPQSPIKAALEAEAAQNMKENSSTNTGCLFAPFHRLFGKR